MKAKEIIHIMNNWALPELIDHWDNTGFQIGDENKEINRILIALDIDNDIYYKAIDNKFDMIITHHPLIFKPIRSITTLSYKENLIYNIIKNDIIVFNAHTNLDQAQGGVNDILADLLQLINCVPLKTNSTQFEREYGYGKVGDIEDIPLVEYIKIIKEKLDIDHLIVYGDEEVIVKRVAVCGGSGSDFIYDAYNKKADLYITGDIKYHEAQFSSELGLTLIDAGHYNTEKIILPVIKEYLDKQTNKDIYIEIYAKPSPRYKLY